MAQVLSPPSPVQLKVYQLAVDVNSVADAVTVPALCLQSIWQKAEELINSSGSIVSAPGHSEQAKMVLSRSGNRPHWYYLAKVGDINVILSVLISSHLAFVHTL